jgi:hypothetical protein
MVNTFIAATQMARNAQESLYFGKMTVREYQKGRNAKTKLTEETEVIVLEDIPCRLSFESVKAAEQTETTANVSQAVKLFLSPDISVKAGSKITVTQDEITRDYTYSGIPAVYPTHQEIMLDVFRGYA